MTEDRHWSPAPFIEYLRMFPPSRVASLRALTPRRPPANASRALSSSTASTSSTPNAGVSTNADSPPRFFKITLLRSAIALGARKKATLASLGIHRRMQTVYHPHAPEFAGKILAVKELVRVENVGPEAVRTKEEQRRERKAVRGFEVIGGLRDGVLEASA